MVCSGKLPNGNECKCVKHSMTKKELLCSVVQTLAGSIFKIFTTSTDVLKQPSMFYRRVTNVYKARPFSCVTALALTKVRSPKILDSQGFGEAGQTPRLSLN